MCSSLSQKDMEREVDVMTAEFESLFGSAPPGTEWGDSGRSAEIGAGSATHSGPTVSSHHAQAQGDGNPEAQTTVKASSHSTSSTKDASAVEGLPAPVVNITYNIHIHHHHAPSER